MPTAYVLVPLKSFDINYFKAFLAGATFFPSSPIVKSLDKIAIKPWLDLDDEFKKYLKEYPNWFILTSLKRSDIRHYLRNSDLPGRGATKKQRKADSSFKG